MEVVCEEGVVVCVINSGCYIFATWKYPPFLLQITVTIKFNQISDLLKKCENLKIEIPILKLCWESNSGFKNYTLKK